MRGTPGTALRSPAGKYVERAGRHCRSTARKIRTVVATPAMTVVPKMFRSAASWLKVPVRRGRTTPQMTPASAQPANASSAMA